VVDALQAAGANVHLAYPLGVKALAKAWIARPAVRELRELVPSRQAGRPAQPQQG